MCAAAAAVGRAYVCSDSRLCMLSLSLRSSMLLHLLLRGLQLEQRHWLVLACACQSGAQFSGMVSYGVPAYQLLLAEP